MTKATDELLETHRVMGSLLEKLDAGDARFYEILKTLRRVADAHSWFEESLFYPALSAALDHREELTEKLAREHGEFKELLESLQQHPSDRTDEREIAARELRQEWEAHSKRERDELYPLAERILDQDTLRRLAEEMERRKTEARDVVFQA